MEFGQKFGYVLLTGIPAFVGAGFIYDIFDSIKGLAYVLALAWVAAIYIYSVMSVTGKLSRGRAE